LTTNTTDIVKAESFELAINNFDGEISEMMTDIAGPSGIDPRMLPTVHAPAGGGVNWQLPDKTAVQVIEGVIIHWRDPRRRFDKPYGGGNEPPACFSEDGITGKGNPGGLCNGDASRGIPKCRFNEFGTHPDPKRPRAKGCEEQKLVYVIRSGFLLPLTVQVASGSLKSFTQYGMMMLDFGGAKYRHITKIGLKEEKSSEGVAFSEVTFERGDPVGDDDAAKIREYAKELIPFLDRQPVFNAEGETVDS